MTRKRGRNQVTEATAERRARVVALRRERRPWDEIGRQLGVTAQRAHQVYREALAARPDAAVDEHRSEALDLIDRAMNDLLAIATDPDRSVGARLDAWTAIVRWAERHARLTGTDAPTRRAIEVITRDALDLAIERAQAEHTALCAELDEIEELDDSAVTSDNWALPEWMEDSR